MNVRSGVWLASSLACWLGCTRSEEGVANVRNPGAASASVASVTAGLASTPVRSSAEIAPVAPQLPSPRAPCVTTLQSTGARPLTTFVGGTPDERSAVRATASELRRVLEKPEEFFATVVTAADLVLLELWHESAFSPENCAVRGNPGGRGRTFAFDPRRGRIVSTKFWQ